MTQGGKTTKTHIHPRVLVATIVLSFGMGCGYGRDESSEFTNVTISGLSSTENDDSSSRSVIQSSSNAKLSPNLTTNSPEIMIYFNGVRSEGTTFDGAYYFNTTNGSTTTQVSIPNGVYKVSSFGYLTPYMQGLLKCGFNTPKGNVKLQGVDQTITMVLDSASCSSTTITDFSFKALTVQQCAPQSVGTPFTLSSACSVSMNASNQLPKYKSAVFTAVPYLSSNGSLDFSTVQRGGISTCFNLNTNTVHYSTISGTSGTQTAGIPFPTPSPNPAGTAAAASPSLGIVSRFDLFSNPCPTSGTVTTESPSVSYLFNGFTPNSSSQNFKVQKSTTESNSNPTAGFYIESNYAKVILIL